MRSDQDHPLNGYDFALRAFGRCRFGKELHEHTIRRELFQVDSALPTISSEYCNESQVWNVTYHASSLFKQAGNKQVSLYGMLSMADQESVAAVITTVFDGTSSERILPML